MLKWFYMFKQIDVTIRSYINDNVILFLISYITENITVIKSEIHYNYLKGSAAQIEEVYMEATMCEKYRKVRERKNNYLSHLKYRKIDYSSETPKRNTV